jgi:8-amino-7-oxononanoate synthase
VKEILSAVKSYQEQGLFRQLRLVQNATARGIQIAGRELVNLSSNDYLGLAHHAELIEVARQALADYGLSACSSRLISGHTQAHAELEQELAEFFEAERALAFNCGYVLNLGVISCLVGDEDVIFSDQLNHASIVDGCRLSRARVRIFPHRDLAALEALVQEGNYRRRLIVTESLFSMDGDSAPLLALTELAQKYNAWLMIDEAHALGTKGPQGKGLAHQQGVSSASVQISMGTFGKALGCFGAFLVGKKELIDYLVNSCRPLIYSTALPPVLAAAAKRALKLLRKADDLRQRLNQNAKFLRQGLVGLGFNTLAGDSHIIPVIIGPPDPTKEAGRILMDHGVYAPAIRPPTVPADTGRIRCSLTASHTEEDLGQVLYAFGEMGKKLRLI